MVTDQSRVALVVAAAFIVPAMWHAFAAKLPRIGFLLGRMIRAMLSLLSSQSPTK
jgi:hypothetical protein